MQQVKTVEVPPLTSWDWLQKPVQPLTPTKELLQFTILWVTPYAEEVCLVVWFYDTVTFIFVFLGHSFSFSVFTFLSQLLVLRCPLLPCELGGM